jgi:methyl-accepting chemotaxis protein
LQISSSTLEKNILDGIRAKNEANAEVLNVKLKGQLDILYELANRARTRTMDWETVRTSLLPEVSRIDALDMAMITPDGIAHYIVDDTTANLGDREYVRQAMGGQPAIGVVFSRVTSQIVVMFAAPVLQNDQSNAPVSGVLIARKDGGHALSDLVVALRSTMPSGYSFLVDVDGTFIAHPNRDLVTAQFNPIRESENNPSVKELGDVVATALKEREGYAHFHYEGKNLIGTFSEVPDHPWLLFSTIERHEVDSQLTSMRVIVLLIGLALIVVGLVIAFFIGRSIAKPVSSIAEILKEVGQGDLTHRINISTKDEIGDLSGNLNSTLEKINGLIMTIKKESETLSGIGNTLANNSTESAAAVTQIAASIQTVKSRVVNQSASVNETHATMAQISDNIDKLNANVESQSSSVSQSSSAIEEMLANIQSVTQTLIKNADNVKELMEASEVGRAGLQGVASDIQEIARESEGLLEINAVMENIASQTNLLSMNAAIEAAHAGESGKGFAVVAGEIRKLAESSSAQSKTISDVLRKIKSAIDKITKSTGNVLDRFASIDSGIKTVSDQEENIRNAMEEQSNGSKKILEAIGHLNEITLQVKSSSEQMLQGSKEIITESGNLEKVTEEISGRMSEMTSGADQINIAVNEVNKISEQNKEIIGNLAVAVSRFKVN